MIDDDPAREVTPEEVLLREAGTVTLDDMAFACELLGAWGTTADHDQGHLHPDIRAAVGEVVAAGRGVEAILAVLITMTATFHGVLAQPTVQQALSLSAMSLRNGYGPQLTSSGIRRGPGADL